MSTTGTDTCSSTGGPPPRRPVPSDHVEIMVAGLRTPVTAPRPAGRVATTDELDGTTVQVRESQG